MHKLAGLAVGLSLLAVPFTSFAASTITTSAGVGAVVSPVGVTVVPTGSVQAFSFGAMQGYTLSNVSVDGVSEGAINSLDFTGLGNSTDNITASATANGGGGLVYCSGPLAPGYVVGAVGGGCGAATTFVQYNQPVSDGTLCPFWMGCMIKNK